MARSIISGIYLITNQVNGKVYVGSSGNCHVRICGHKYGIRTGTHGNKYLQASGTLHGIENFTFEIWEHCPINLLAEREAYWIQVFDATDRDCGYNIAHDTVCPARGLKRPENMLESRMVKIRKTRKLVDSNGVVFETSNTKEFCKTHKLNYCSMGVMANGFKHSNKGWRLATEQTIGVKFEFNQTDFLRAVTHKLKKTYQLLGPDGNVVTFTGFNEFCRNNKLNNTALNNVLKGTRNYHKGYRRI
jgi:group I intron endonuclease